MAIQGLKKYILDNNRIRQRISLHEFANYSLDRSHGAPQLLCDFVDTVKWLLSDVDNCLVKRGQLSPFSVLCGGDLRVYTREIVNFCRSLIEVGVQPVFFVFSPPGTAQGECESRFNELKEQSLQKVKEVSIIHQVCDGVASLGEVKWRLTEFTALHIESVLKSEGVQIVYWTSGIYSEIVGYCQRNKQAFGILSGNTELVIPSGSRLFLPELFQFQRLCSDVVEHPSQGITCEFVTSANLACFLHIDEEQLRDLAILCGNGFTNMLNECLRPCATLMLPDSNVTTVAQWLSGKNKSLLECDGLKEFLETNASYRDALIHSYRSYACLESKKSKEIELNKLRYVSECVRNGTMSSHLLSMVSGYYWRPVISEPVTLDRTCFVDLTFLLRKSVYAILGVESIQEFGRTSQNSFVTISSQELPELDFLEELCVLRQKSTNEKLSLLFRLVGGEKEILKLDEALENETHRDTNASDDCGAAVLVCSALLFMFHSNFHFSPSPDITICELEALLLTCLTSLAGFSGFIVTNCPSSRAIIVSDWFSHVLQQSYLIASLFGLTGKLPSPGEVFSSILYLSFHSASYTSIEKEMKGYEDDKNVSESVNEDSQMLTALKLFNKVIDLESVLSLRAEILSGDKADLKTFIVLFSKALKAVNSALCDSGLKQSALFSVGTVYASREKGSGDELAADTNLEDTDSSSKAPQVSPPSCETTHFKDDECEEDSPYDCAIMADIDDLHNCSDVSHTDCEELSSTQEQQVAEEDVFFLHGGLEVNAGLDFEHFSDELDTLDNEKAVDIGDSDASNNEKEIEEDSAFDALENSLPWSLERTVSKNDLQKEFNLSSQCESGTLPQTRHSSSSLENSSLDNQLSPGAPSHQGTSKDGLLLVNQPLLRSPSQHITPKQRPPSTKAQLPVVAHKKKILELIQSHSVVILEGETGCGKSTNVPQFILDESLKCPSKPCKILITQPRRVAAMKLAEQVALNRRERVGKTVGFCISGDSQRSADTAITYCTTGYLLQILVNNPKAIGMYTHIILDEIHERSTDAEFALLVVRKLVVDVRGFKVILMSATMQGDLFVSYFEQVLPKSEVASPYFVGAKQYDIDVYFMDELVSLAERKASHWHTSQLEAAAALKTLVRTMPKENLQTAMKVCPSISKFATAVSVKIILSQGERGESILVFLPGIAEIMSYQETLLQELGTREIVNSFSVFILHSQVPFEEQKGLFNPPPSNKVHIILATNIAESSITLPKLRLVINFGIYRQLQYDHKRRFSCLVKCWCSHSSCAQRVGRAGRVFKGVAVHLFTRRFYEVILPEYNSPDILFAPLAKLVLQAKQIGAKLGFSSPSEFLMLALEPPSLEQMEIAVQDLADVGAIVSEPGKEVMETADITILGNFSLSLPVDILLCRLVLFGIFLAIPTEAIVIAAEMSLTQDVFSLPSRCVIEDEGQYFEALLRSIDTRVGYDSGQFSESFIVCRMFKEWIEYRNSNARSTRVLPKNVLVSNFCRSHAVRSTRLLQLETTVAQIASRVMDLLPQGCQLYGDVSSLATISQYGSINRKGSFLHRTYTKDSGFKHVSFSEDPLILKSLLVASFSHQMIVGVREMESHFSKMQKKAQSEMAYMVETRIDPTRTIVMRNVEHKCSSVLYELLRRLLPGVLSDINILSNTIFIHLLPPPSSIYLHQAVTCGRNGSNLFKAEAWKTFEQEISVISKKLSRDLYIIWQFGERKAVWTVDGIRASFTRPHHPMSLAWYNLSIKKEQVGISTFRNPSAFVCDFSSSSPFLGVATTMQGCEHKNFIVARKLTILPSLGRSATALLLAIAFQSLNSSLELLVDSMGRKVTGIKINSHEIIFGDYQSITEEDIIRINVLRRSISEALRPHTASGTLSMEKMSNIRPLIECVLKRTPFQPSTACSLSPPNTTESISLDFCIPQWEKQFYPPPDDDSDGDDSEFEMDSTVEQQRLSQTGYSDQNGFCFFPSLMCSLLESSIFKESDVEQLLRPSTDQDKSATSFSCLNEEIEKPISTMFKLSPLAKPFIPIVNPRCLPHKHRSSSSCVKKCQASKEDHKLKNQDLTDKSPMPLVPTCPISKESPPSPIPMHPIAEQGLVDNTMEQEPQDAGNSVCVSESLPAHNSLVYSLKKSFEAEVGSLQTPSKDYHTSSSEDPSKGELQPVHFNLPQLQRLRLSVMSQSLTGSVMNLFPPSNWHSSQAAAYFEELCSMMMFVWEQQAMVQRTYSNTVGHDSVGDPGSRPPVTPLIGDPGSRPPVTPLASVEIALPLVARSGLQSHSVSQLTCKDPSSDEKSASLTGVDFPSEVNSPLKVSAELLKEKIFSPFPQEADETESLRNSQPSPDSQAWIQMSHFSPITLSQDLSQPQNQVHDLEQVGDAEFLRTGSVFLPPSDPSIIPLPASNSSLQSSSDASQESLSCQTLDQDSQHLFDNHSEDKLEMDSQDKSLDVLSSTHTVPLLMTPSLTVTPRCHGAPMLISPPGIHNAYLIPEPLNRYQMRLPCTSRMMLSSDFEQPFQSGVQPLLVEPGVPQSAARSVGMKSPTPINEIQHGATTWSHQREFGGVPPFPVGSPASHMTRPLSTPGSPASHMARTLPPPGYPASHWPHHSFPPCSPASHMARTLPPPGYPASHWAHPFPPGSPASHMARTLPSPDSPASRMARTLPSPGSPASRMVRTFPPPYFPASHSAPLLSSPGSPASHMARTLLPPGSPPSHRAHPLSPQASHMAHTLPPPGSPASPRAHPFSPPPLQNSKETNITPDSTAYQRLNLSSPSVPSQGAHFSNSLSSHPQKDAILIPPSIPQPSQTTTVQQKALLLSLDQVASLGSQTQPQHLKYGPHLSQQSNSTHRYTRPVAYVNPPFGGPFIQPPFPSFSSPQAHLSSRQRREKHPPSTSAYTRRYDRPPWFHGMVKSLPVPVTASSPHVGAQEETSFVNNEANFENESRKQSSTLWSQAYLRDSDHHNSQSIGHGTTRVGKEGRQKMSKTPSQEIDGVLNQDLVDFYVRTLFLLGDAELNQLCGAHYRQFLEQRNMQGSAVILDPCFFTVRNKVVFEVCGPPGMYRVSLTENTRHLVASHHVPSAILLDKESVWSEESGNCVKDTESKETGQVWKGTIVPSNRSRDCNEEYSPSIEGMISGQVTVQLPSPSNRNDCTPCSDKIDVTLQQSDSSSDKIIEGLFSKMTDGNTQSDRIDTDKSMGCQLHSCEVVYDLQSDEIGFDPCFTIDSSQSTWHSNDDMIIFDSVTKGKNEDSVSKPTIFSEVEGNQPAIEGYHLTKEQNESVIEENEQPIEESELAMEIYHMAIEGNELAIEGNELAIEGNELAIEESEPTTERSELANGENETILEMTVGSGEIIASNCISPMLDLHAKYAIGGNTSTLNLTASKHTGSESNISSKTTSILNIEPSKLASAAVGGSFDSSVFSSSNKVDYERIVEFKGDFKVEDYSTRCINAATAVATSSSPSLSLPAPTLFDEDCWIEDNSPVSISEQPPASIEEDNSVSVQTANTLTKRRHKSSQKESHYRPRKDKESIEKKEKKDRQDSLKGKRLMYKRNDSGWENLDVVAGGASIQSLETDSQIVESEKTHQVSKKTCEDKVSSRHPSSNCPKQPAVGSLPHFEMYTDNVLLKEGSIPLPLHFSNYRHMFNLSKTKYWYNLRDLRSASESFEIECHGRSKVFVRKSGSCPSVGSKVDKSQETVEIEGRGSIAPEEPRVKT